MRAYCGDKVSGFGLLSAELGLRFCRLSKSHSSSSAMARSNWTCFNWIGLNELSMDSSWLGPRFRSEEDLAKRFMLLERP